MKGILLVPALLAVASCAAPPEWPGPSRPYRSVVHVIPGTIEAEDFDEGGEGVAYHDTDPQNQEKHQPPYRDSGVDLEWREDASGQYNLGWTRAGEWLVYTVDVRETGTYTHLEFNGTDRTGPIEVPDTGSWKTLKPFSFPGVQLKSGRYAMKVVMDKAGDSRSIGDIDYFRFVKP